MSPGGKAERIRFPRTKRRGAVDLFVSETAGSSPGKVHSHWLRPRHCGEARRYRLAGGDPGDAMVPVERAELVTKDMDLIAELIRNLQVEHEAAFSCPDPARVDGRVGLTDVPPKMRSFPAPPSMLSVPAPPRVVSVPLRLAS